MQSLNNRIQAVLREAGLSQADLARITRTTDASVAHWVSGRTKTLKAETALLIQEQTGFSARWIISGDGPRMARETARPIRTRVPVIDARHAGEEITEQMVSKYLPITAEWPRAFALRVTGDSMTSPHGRSYPAGCYVIIDPDQRTVHDGDRIAARLHNGDVTVKVFKSEDGRRWLAPLNPSHLPLRAAFEVIGKVVGKWEEE